MVYQSWRHLYNSASSSYSSHLIDGYLRDNNGGLHELPSAYVTTLKDKDIPPDGKVKRGNREVPIWDIALGGEVYYVSGASSWRSVNACVYNATLKYIESLSLGSLTSGDKDWFRDHPNVETDGVSRTYVLGVVHGLVYPWGLGIDRVFVPRMSAINGEYREFADVLGMNPMAVQDGGTSNAEFAERVGVDIGEVNRLFRFEFVDSPPGPCVVMTSSLRLANDRVGNSKTNRRAVSTGNVGGVYSSTFGHADFIGPRDLAGSNWVVAVTVAKRDRDYLSHYREYDKDSDPVENLNLSLLQSRLKCGETILGMRSMHGGGNVATTKQPVLQPPLLSAPGDGPIWPANNDASGASAVGSSGPQDGAADIIDLPDPCPECGGPVVMYKGLILCIACDWFNDMDECPFCGSDLSNSAKCDCGFSRTEQIRTDESCYDHHSQPCFKDVSKQSALLYCPGCVSGTDYAEFIRDGVPRIRQQTTILGTVLGALPSLHKRGGSDEVA